ncbi:hypothetical protein BDV06DRAFT_213690 [Aspergillus oleicola]
MGLPRKSHRKSRRGCIECKRRHIKCDERHPKCVNCDVSLRYCSYEEMVSEARAFVPAAASQSKSYLTTSPGGPSTSNLGADSPPLNKLHLELFHHFVSHILTFFCLDDRLSPGYSSLEMLKCILGAPYLMNEILAFAALHLSIICPLQQTFYRHHAAELQTHALTEFNGSNIDPTPESCLPMFLFSSILALHMLSNQLLFRIGDLEAFLEDFVQSLRLHRGVRAVTNQSWPVLLQSPLKSLLKAEENALANKADATSGDDCSKLIALVDHSPSLAASPRDRDTYKETIGYLQSAFDGSRQHPSGIPAAIGPIISWPVLVPPRYVDLLAERRQEALVILAYFGLLLHMHREMWTFGDSGLYIITSIRDYLGPQWAEWLVWPSEFL